MTDTLPSFVIVGAMKCGTTSLAMWLAGHPEVFVASQKEVHFFDDHYERGLDWYRRQFSGSARHKAIGEATPNYMNNRSAMDRMAGTLPDAKLIVMLRNPVDRAYSHYWHNKGRGREPEFTFAQALDAEPDRIRVAGSMDSRRYSYMDRGLYARQIEFILRSYKQSAIHFILLDDIKRDARGEFASVCRFLGIDERICPQEIDMRANEAIQVRSMRVQYASKLLPKRLKKLVGKLNSRPLSYPRMEAEVRSRLIEYYKPANKELAWVIGRDLSAWSA